MVLPRSLLLRRLRPSPSPIRSSSHITLAIRTIGTSNVHAPENSSPKSASNPSLRPSNTTHSRLINASNAQPVTQANASAKQAEEQQVEDVSVASPTQLEQQRGTLASSSIFGRRSHAAADPSESSRPERPERNLESVALALDPRPYARRRWERKIIIRTVQRRGRLTKAEVIKRTERECLARSPFWRTSVKKLQPLARQIAGKTIDEAIVQMTFSKKKNAERIKAYLEEARDMAIVERGMGLGAANGTQGRPAVVRDRDGNRRVVKDRTAIYIAQAWVGKGSYGRDALPRARGRVDLLRLPQTSISLLLKEEATLVREHQDRQTRLHNRRVWTQLPDRPITDQRPYYSW